MFKMSTEASTQTMSPLINSIIHSALFQSTPHGDKTSLVVSKQ